MALTNSSYNALPQLSSIELFARMEEASGSRTDESDNGHTLTDVNTVGSTTGKIGTCATMVAANQEGFSITDDATLKPTGNFSIAAWFKHPDPAGTTRFIFQSYNSAGNINGFYFCIHDPNDNLYVKLGDFTGVTQGSDWEEIHGDTNCVDDTWTHGTFVYDGTDIRLYLNGSLDCTPVAYTAGVGYTTNTVNVGYYMAGGLHFNGEIDELILWNGAALTAPEVTTVYDIQTLGAYKKSSSFLMFL